MRETRTLRKRVDLYKHRGILTLYPKDISPSYYLKSYGGNVRDIARPISQTQTSTGEDSFASSPLGCWEQDKDNDPDQAASI